VTELTAAPINPQSQQSFQNIVGSHTFNLIALCLTSIVFSLGKLTAYAADQNGFFSYSASAMALSQSLVIVSLSFFGRALRRVSQERMQIALTLLAILLANIFGSILFETILHSWNLEPITQSFFQRVISLLFSTFLYLGFGWTIRALGRNFAQVKLANELLAELSKKQLELSRDIRDARAFSTRELSLEIQSTLLTIDTFTTSNSVGQKLEAEIGKLKTVFSKIESQLSQIRNRFPGPTGASKNFSIARYSLPEIVSAGIKPNGGLPVLVSTTAFFGFSSWLSFFMDERHAAFWGISLSTMSFGIFFGYEKYISSKLVTRAILIRILVFELFVISYLFFWLLILGYFAGDDSGAYLAALVFAAIPFLFFNAGIVLIGVVTSSQVRREQLVLQASNLRTDLAALERIRSDEDKVWKSLFAGDISLSPTTASVILRDATIAKEQDQVALATTNANALWNSVLVKMANLT
jgi:hypothetical protein